MTDDPRHVSSELVSLRVLREQRWTYERRMRRETWAQIEAATGKPTAEGGLGYRLGAGTLRRLHRAYVAEQIDLEQRTREEHVHVAVAELDVVQAAIDAQLVRLARAADVFDEPMETSELVALLDRRLRVNAERRKLLGLDAPTRADVSVTVERDLDAELANLLQASGAAPDERIDR